jgi:hypothetical protein
LELIVRQAPQELAALSKALKEAGERDLRRELYAGLNRATKPMIRASRVRMLAQLPARGGLNRRAAKARISTQQRRSRGGDPQIHIRGRAGSQAVDLRAIDSGLIRHPVFGRPDSWVMQRITAGTWTYAMLSEAPQARREVEAALDDVAAKLDKVGRRT